MTDLEKVTIWDDNLVIQGIVEKEELFEWLKEENVFFTPGESVVPAGGIVFESEEYIEHIIKLKIESDDNNTNVISTLGLEALIGKIIFKSHDTRAKFWKELKIVFTNLNISFPNIEI